MDEKRITRYDNSYLLAQGTIWQFSPYLDLLGSDCNEEKEPKDVE